MSASLEADDWLVYFPISTSIMQCIVLLILYDIWTWDTKGGPHGKNFYDAFKKQLCTIPVIVTKLLISRKQHFAGQFRYAKIHKQGSNLHVLINSMLFEQMLSCFAFVCEETKMIECMHEDYAFISVLKGIKL